MKIPTMMLFVDSDQVEVMGFINEKGINKESIKGSPLSLAYEAVFTNLPVAKELNEAIPAYNKAFHEYNEVSMTDENMAILKRCGAKVDSLQDVQMQQLFAYIFVHFIASQQGRQHPLFCWQPVITPILLHRLYHITPFSTIYLYFALFIYPSCRNAQFPQALPKYDLA
jgi:hypothetical protein